MKLTLKLFVSLAFAPVLFMTGCAGRISPLTAQSLTTLAVYEIARNNSGVADYMRKVQPPVCAIATLSGATFEDVIDEIVNTSDASVEEKAAINIILSIFQTSTDGLTNSVAQRPYLKAVFCDGWAGGLAISPDEAIKGVIEAPKRVRGQWHIIK